ncbi:DUF1391 domain-containing protein [Salmonella enterica]|uniref:DUF1391 domain-containing protein n=2 Tax=Salmonella enterica TaxID=28901 RepID=A0A5U1RBE5_SALER|nr:DUF1391 domain-containing protein [Salmonella enterica]ECB7204103.1 DUF1391 domain-containing protein [Salmonella enterica subsp. enterica serovar Abaetetuba]ECC2871675.1 DUF1391 domain-containing protein [Salmonella enterica subsp. enterica serovar Tanger]EAP3036747.1 DUF1391 domain-containing protein [Salmonella enterica]EAP9632620.1 DUF1391 domain-containing protein [Salmonella enterica]
MLIDSNHGTVITQKTFRHPALRGNEVNMDTIDPGNNESLVCGVFPNQDGTFTAMTYTKSKTFKSEAGARRWLARNTD